MQAVSDIHSIESPPLTPDVPNMWRKLPLFTAVVDTQNVFNRTECVNVNLKEKLISHLTQTTLLEMKVDHFCSSYEEVKHAGA